MRFFFDESGGFETRPRGHRAGIVVAAVLPESALDEVFGRVTSFITTLSKIERHKGEPKGARLTDANRLAFCELAAECEDLMLAVTMLDITPLAKMDTTTLRTSIIQQLNSLAGQCRYETMRNEVILLAKQVGNLSIPQTLRLTATARCVMRALNHAVVRFAADCYRPCWNTMSFELDSVQTRPGNREQQVFELLLPAWITAWSIKYPITTVEELHTPDHPFIERYGHPDGINLGEILKGNVHWRDSSANPGIQIADMAAAVVSRAAHGMRGIATAREIADYAILMKRALLPQDEQLGIFSIVETARDDIGRRYAGVLDTVLAVRRGCIVPKE
jgi:hypothetical protein